jgi:hypothetical protein
MIRNNSLPPSSGFKNKANKHPAKTKAANRNGCEFLLATRLLLDYTLPQESSQSFSCDPLIQNGKTTQPHRVVMRYPHLNTVLKYRAMFFPFTCLHHLVTGPFTGLSRQSFSVLATQPPGAVAQRYIQESYFAGCRFHLGRFSSIPACK